MNVFMDANTYRDSPDVVREYWERQGLNPALKTKEKQPVPVGQRAQGSSVNVSRQPGCTGTSRFKGEDLSGCLV